MGHSTGGASISYALERFPEKISKAIFLCATMVSDGQRPFDVFSEEVNNKHSFSSDPTFTRENAMSVFVSCAYIWEKLSYVDAAWFCREVHERVAVLDLRERKRQASYRVHV